MRTKHSMTALAALVVLSTGATIGLASVPAAAAPRATAAAPAAHDDFNGDGYADAVVAAPDGIANGARGAGYVAVLYGSANGLKTSSRAVITQSTAGVPGTPEAGDAFGAAVTSQDLDRDGYADLVVGAPGEDVGTAADAGGVTVLWGSARGLTGTSSWLQEENPAAKEAYGTALTTGDTDGDGHKELAAITRSGALYGYDFTDTRTPTAPEFLLGTVAQEDGFVPTGLTAGDYDKDGSADIVVLGTEPQLENVQSRSVYVKSGPEGLTVERKFSGGTAGASGDVNKDGYEDLVVGDPRVLEHGEWDLSAGAVQVRYGSAHGLFGEGGEDTPQVFEQGKDGIPGESETGDDFGGDVSLGDVNGDGYLDLAIGSEGEAVGDPEAKADSGAVWLLRGSANGLTSAGVQNINQDTANVPGVTEGGDRFGTQVRLVDANKDGRADLVATAPTENYTEGYAWVFAGTGSGAATNGSWSFGATSVGASTDNAKFGTVVGH